MIAHLRKLVLVPCKYPLRTLLALFVLLVLAGFSAPYLWAEYHYRAARQDVEDVNYAGAVTHLTQCLRVWHADVQIHFLLAQTARRAGALEDAEHHLEICEQRAARDEALELERMLLRVQRGELASLAGYLEKRAQNDSPQTLLILEALAMGYLRTYELRHALTCIGRVLELRPNHVPALLWRGQVMEHLSRPEEAADDYRHALAIDPGEKWARLSLGDVLLKLNQPGEALEHFEYLSRRQPADPSTRLGLACCRRLLGQGEEARQILDGLLRKHPEEPRVLFERGKLAQDDGEMVVAEGLLRRACQRSPFEVGMMYAFYQCLESAGKRNEAKEVFAKLEQVDRDKKRLIELTKTVVEKRRAPVERTEAGILCLRLGMVEHGLGLLNGAIQEDPGNVQALETLADYYEHAGNTRRAAEYRRRAHDAKQMNSKH